MTNKVRIGSINDFAVGALTSVDVDGTSVIVARDDEGVCAARNKCPHMGMSLTSGPGGERYEDGVIQCPWHNSRFVLRSGENIDWASGFAGRQLPKWSQSMVRMGKSAAPLTTYTVVVEGDDVFVEI